ncbi:MAG: translocation/assembly module TamB domain-containing protein [Gemmatimonadaceae bacterium]
MTRRRVVALASTGVIVLILLGLAGAFVSITHTDLGRAWTRRVIVSLIDPAFRGKGKLFIGHIGGNFIDGVTVDSLAIHDADDSLFISTGPITVVWDPRDLIDKRLLLRALDVQHPVVNLRRHANWEWNFSRIFKSDGPASTRGPGRGFGDYIVIHDLRLHDGRFIVTQPWSPDDTLRGRARDAAVAQAIAAPEHVVRRTSEGLKKTWQWSNAQAQLPYARIADPDSVGELFDIARLDVDEADPPLVLRNVRGPVRIRGDTVWFEGRHFDLPASTGSASGKVWWGSDLPVRYDVTIRADTFALDDINWVYETLPRTGGGSAVLTIKNNPRDLRLLDYGVHKLDVRTTRSHLTGAMTFGVGGPVLVVKDVDMDAAPMDFDLVRTLNGKPFPVDWQGVLTGHVKGRGGPLNRFVVDSSRLVFSDKHVPGAISRASARGELDILYPALTVFRGLDVAVQSLDLRTPRFLFPNFPQLNGIVFGRARLDSSWLDVRFSNADLTHADGPGPVTHFTGHGRLIDEPKTVVFDVDGIADSVAFTTLAKSYVNLPLRGNFAGPLIARGTIDSLQLITTLSGAAGTFSVNGWFDDDPPGYAAHASGTVTALDVRVLLDRPSLPSTRITAKFSGDVRGDSLANLEGVAALDVERSRVDTARIYAATARLRFESGRVRVDSLRVESNIATATVHGALGLAAGVTDSLALAVDVDSLGALRPWIRKPPTLRGARALATPDSGVRAAERDSVIDAMGDRLTGTIAVRATVSGSVGDSIRVAGTADGRELFDAGDQVRRALVSFDFAGLPRAMHGTARASLDTASLVGVGVVRTDALLVMPSSRTGRVSASASTTNGVRAATGLRFTVADSITAVALDTLSLSIRDRRWTLAAPASGEFDGDGLTIASPLALVDGVGGRIEIAGLFHAEQAGDASLRVIRLPLADLGVLAQSAKPLGGWLDSLDLRLQGTTLDPTMRFRAVIDSARYGTVRMPRLAGSASYAKRMMIDTVRVTQSGAAVVTAAAALPLDLALAAVAERKVDGPLHVRIAADTVSLAVFSAVATQDVEPTSGTLSSDLDITGTWQAPHFAGRLQVANGVVHVPPLGVTFNRLNADLALMRDTLVVRRFSTYSDAPRGDSASISGTVSLAEFRHPVLNLAVRMDAFQVMRLRSVADLQLTTRLKLAGRIDDTATMRVDGDVTVVRGTIYLPELQQKQLVDLSDKEFETLIDTSFAAPAPPTDILKRLAAIGVRLQLSDDVWLRSREANVKMSGAVEISGGAESLSYAGQLQADRGTYLLDLGLLQRSFDVDSGRVTFYNNVNIAPQIDIFASYIVRQLTRQDVHIRAHIYNVGSLKSLRLELSSDERYALSYTEILSYLLFGAPSFAVGSGQRSTVQQAAAIVLPTLGAAVQSALADQLGGVFDLFYVQTGTGSSAEDPAVGQNQAFSILNSTRIGVSGQLSNRFFYSVSAGVSLCPTAISSSTGQAFQFGALRPAVSGQYRFQRGLWAQVSAEPSTLQGCNNNNGSSSPRYQLGFDLFKQWTF